MINGFFGVVGCVDMGCVVGVGLTLFSRNSSRESWKEVLPFEKKFHKIHNSSRIFGGPVPLLPVGSFICEKVSENSEFQSPKFRER